MVMVLRVGFTTLAGPSRPEMSLLRSRLLHTYIMRHQVEVSGSDDEFLTVLNKFRHTLLGIPLPPPAPVDYEQALKDAQRESIEVLL